MYHTSAEAAPPSTPQLLQPPPPNKISFSSKKQPGDPYASQACLKLTVFPNTHASDSGNSRVRHQVG